MKTSQEYIRFDSEIWRKQDKKVWLRNKLRTSKKYINFASKIKIGSTTRYDRKTIPPPLFLYQSSNCKPNTNQSSRHQTNEHGSIISAFCSKKANAQQVHFRSPFINRYYIEYTTHNIDRLFSNLLYSYLLISHS